VAVSTTCASIITVCCPSGIPETLTCVLSGGTGGCACLDGSYDLTYMPDTQLWESFQITVCGTPFYITLRCWNPPGGPYWLLSGFTELPYGVSSWNCCPFNVVFPGLTAAIDDSICGDGSDTVTATITGNSDNCPGVTTDCCEGTPIPFTLYATLTDAGAGCECIEGVYELTYYAPGDYWDSGVLSTGCGDLWHIQIQCREQNAWGWEILGVTLQFQQFFDCDPVFIQYNQVRVAANICGTGVEDVTITITETI
jgi:hypothetical protein